jgi:hypothetical protein
MKTQRMVSIVFALSGVYDGLLGSAFLLAPASLFANFGVTPPNHWGYVQFGAAVLIVFAIMFFQVAANPAANRNLIPYGILVKLAYTGVVLAYWLSEGLPDMWKPFAIIDTVFAILFTLAWLRLAPHREVDR